jgi:protein HIRA/HIR1
MASQSSEDKKLTVWRVQNYKNVTKDTEIDLYYKSQTFIQSLFRRLSWSADGAFISTTGGRVGNENISPLIDRNQWNLLAALSGHSKPITVSRINSTLYKNKTDGNQLSCYSVIALGSAESTITVWQPSLEKPLVIMMDSFNLGVTDLSWGFNGNILLASSNDGSVVVMHF